MEKNSTTTVLFIILITVTSIATFAQKLPTKQEVSVYAPANIKIDGKANEWDNEFKAYNKATDVYYTIANDNNNLYLIIQAVKPRIITKIIEAGATFIIKNTTDNKNNIEITYPVIDIPIGISIILNSGGKTTERQFFKEPDTLVKDTPTPSDSLKNIANKQLVANANMIRVEGIKEIRYSETSVYNEQGIKVAAAFDHSGAYTYELVVPLKYLSLSQDLVKKISYGIKLNSRLDQGKHFMTYYNKGVDIDADLDTATDFSGEYILANKP